MAYLKKNASMHISVGDPNQYVPYINVIFLDDGIVEEECFRAYKSIWFKRREMVQAQKCVPVATAMSAAISVGVQFLFL